MQNNSLAVYVTGSCLPDLHYTELNKETRPQSVSDSLTVLSKIQCYFGLDVERAEQGCSERVENLARYFPLTLLCLHSRVIDPTPHTAAALSIPLPTYLQHPSHYTQHFPLTCDTKLAPTSLETSLLVSYSVTLPRQPNHRTYKKDWKSRLWCCNIVKGARNTSALHLF